MRQLYILDLGIFPSLIPYNMYSEEYCYSWLHWLCRLCCLFRHDLSRQLGSKHSSHKKINFFSAKKRKVMQQEAYQFKMILDQFLLVLNVFNCVGFSIWAYCINFQDLLDLMLFFFIGMESWYLESWKWVNIDGQWIKHSKMPIGYFKKNWKKKIINQSLCVIHCPAIPNIFSIFWAHFIT